MGWFLLGLMAWLGGAGCQERQADPWSVARREVVDEGRRVQPKVKKERRFRESQVGVPVQMVEGESTDSRFGHSVAGAGDVNGDGFADVLVGAFGGGYEKSGEVLLYYGSRTGIPKLPSWRFTCTVAQAEFGHQVEGVGDVNGDRFDDFVVGSTYYSEPMKKGPTGGAFLFLGGTNGPGSKPDWEMIGEEPGSKTGFAVAAAGDVNGDGFADVLVGAWNQTNRSGANLTQGRVSLFGGSANGLSRVPIWQPGGEKIESNYGYAVHGIGDVNGDGFADVAVGSYGFEAEQLNAGRVYVYYGGPSGPSLVPDWTVTGVHAGQILGNALFEAGDVNGDGFDDLLVGANGTIHPEFGEGMVLVFHGGRGGLGLKAAWTFEADRPRFYVGHSVATAGDVNGDGFADVVVSAFNGGQTIVEEGVALVFQGSREGLSRVMNWSHSGGQARGGYGSAVRPGGDIDGDGYDDLLVGQTYYSGSIPNQGRAYVHYGSRTGLALSSGWNRGVESMGFRYRNITVPWPNAVWVSVVAVLSGAGLVLGTRQYYLRGQRRVRALQEAREVAQRQERQRLAQDLHDQLGADLTGLVLAGAHIRHRLRDEAKDMVMKVAQLEATAERLIESLKELVWLTKPANDTLTSLADYLGDMVVVTMEKAGLRCVLEIPPELPQVAIPFDLRHDLVLAVKEALHNAIKHSGCECVTFVLSYQGDSLMLKVVDNGRGVDPAALNRGGNGLVNMTERLARHGGTAELVSVKEGTVMSFGVRMSLESRSIS